jgi:hypothetical protein
MRFPSRDDAGTTRPAELNEADRILLLTLRAWGEDAQRSSGGVVTLAPEDSSRSRLWDRLESSWGQRLRDAWARIPASAGSREGDPGSARAEIERAHRAEARVDPDRVHPSWWVRALKEESPSVRRIVAATAPESVRNAVQAGLLLDNDDLQVDRPADPQTLTWVWSLWSERLVGGESERADDPPVIVAMTGLSPRTGYRLCRLTGIAKRVLAGQDGLDTDMRSASRARTAWFRHQLGSAGPEFGAVARHDVRSKPAANLPRRRRTARLGLLTIARLLADGEPFRVRWALQHWPYTIAKLTRSLMPSDAKRSTVVTQVEWLVLKTAWDRLNLEGHSSQVWPGCD